MSGSQRRGPAVTLSRALGLSPEETWRAAPFFAVYLLLFTALTVADGVAVSLFASRVGADRLPSWYAITAVLSLVMIAGYMTQATRRSGGQMFGWILAVVSLTFMGAWLVYQAVGGAAPLGTLFVTREIALTMVLMHFGTFLQDYFLRAELNRILPIIYAGGRVGGIFGGGMLGWGAYYLGTIHLVPAVVALLLAAWGGIIWISRVVAHREEEDQPQPSPADIDRSQASRGSLWMLQRDSFLGRVVSCPLLRWLSITTLLFIGCRWFLAYQYTSYFEDEFADDAALAAFLGRYTQIALLVSLLLQLFVVNRLVGRLGVPATHLLYSLLVMGGLVGNWLVASLPIAVASRFLESELRFGLRNPVNQMMVNRFPKQARIAVRGWSLGLLIPLGTLAASGVIALLIRWGGSGVVALAGVALGGTFVISAIWVGKAYERFEQPDVRS